MECPPGSLPWSLAGIPLSEYLSYLSLSLSICLSLGKIITSIILLCVYRRGTDGLEKEGIRVPGDGSTHGVSIGHDKTLE